MNKRLIALFLCLVMMLSVFLTGCAQDSEEDAKNELEEAKVASNMTLTMWIVSESPVSESIRADVTKAINALTKAKYKTQLEIHYLSEEEYFDKLTDAMEAYAQTKKEQNAEKPVETDTNGEEAGTTVEAIVTDENGMYRDNYPIVLENQVDIIYIGDVKDGEGNLLMSGQQMYNALRADNWLSALDEAIKGDAKKIKEFVSPTLLSAVQENGVTYAVPNNNVIGNYTYMCLNKAMMDRYSLQGHLTRGSITSFANEYVYQFLNQISIYEEKLNADPNYEVLPVDATYEECLAFLAYYWNVDTEDYSINSNEFSIFGTPLFDTQPNRGQNAVGVQSLLENEEFVSHYLTLNEFRMDKNNVFFRNENNENKNYDAYGVRFLSSEDKGFEIENGIGKYEGADYYLVPVIYPTATADDIYGNMFAVATTTLNVDRSMQIVTYLNTNTEMRNLLQYGIEGQHYTIEGGKVSRVPDKAGNYYEMDIDATGNVFLAHLEPTMDAAIWENGKKQNRDSLVEPMLGFDLSEYASTATQFGTPITVASSKPYTTTFRTGLNKSVFENDAVLGAWIAECDADVEAKGEKGIYVFRSREKTAGNEYSEVLYFYNTFGAYRFSVESEEVTKETGTGYYRNNTYVYTEDADLTGEYTLTMVYDINLVRYEGQYKVVQRQLNEDNEEVSRTERPHIETFTYKDQRYEFDLYNTDSYVLNVYGDLYLGDFYDNKDIFNELVKLWKNDGTAIGNLGLRWVDTTSSTTKDYHSFVLYRKNVSNTTLIDIVPTISENGIKLVVNYNEYTGSAITDPAGYPDEFGVRPGKRYMLYYVTIETDKNVNVSISYNAGQTTTEEELESKFVHEFPQDTATQIMTTINKDIHFEVQGMLNTELVKYMADLNNMVIGLLDGCKTPQELEKMLNDLSILFNTEKALVSVSKDIPNCNAALSNAIEDMNGLIRRDFEMFFYKLTNITNYGTMDEVLGDPRSIIEIKDEYRPAFYSPYGIYYLWMEACGYLPANMKPTK